VDLVQLASGYKIVNEMASWIIAPQYAVYHVVLKPRIKTAITIIDRKKVLTRRFAVGK